MFEAPAKTAKAIDRATTVLMNHPRLEDPNFSLQEDAAFQIDVAFSEASQTRPEALHRFVSLVSDCLLETGKVTRYAIRTATARASAEERFL